MQRIIKFRAWIPYRREMLYKGSRMDLWSYSWLYNGGLARVTPMQYTGLKDKNGKEIYEGDILKGKYYSGIEHIQKVYWASYRWEGIDRYDASEIIGTIYENPDLLEAKDVRDKG